MPMRIGGLQKTSLIEYPGHISAIVFLSGCNLRCPFCHNRDLVIGNPSLREIPKGEFVEWLKTRKKYLDGVSITGGEPLMNDLDELAAFMGGIKGLGFDVKLDTNGGYPEKLERLIDLGLVDYVAMDIKTSREKYEKAAGAKVDIDAIGRSIRLIMEKAKDYEFRTTVVPGLVATEDVEEIASLISGAKRYFLQQFRPISTVDAEYGKIEPYPQKTLEKMRDAAKKYVKEVKIRGI
ncbi:MAG: anaerobic ribonucleoside-triphosphate reductase activating protein [Candidatus Micrarchaeota archaeon]|nr:anaerobic ribonucleoside-triphosphate reductase activating protein [Candidatus Micrarchaeota archaeon]